jgi:hypothetical protein
MHPPLMSLPSRSKSSLVPSASPPWSLLRRLRDWLEPQPSCAFVLSLRTGLESYSPHTSRCPDDCAPSWSFRALRRSLRCSDSANSTCVSLTSTRLTSPGSAASSGFSNPSTLHSASASPTLFRVGVAPGLPFSFEGFSPSVAPGTSRFAVSSVSLSRRLPCGRRARSASRM